MINSHYSIFCYTDSIEVISNSDKLFPVICSATIEYPIDGLPIKSCGTFKSYCIPTSSTKYIVLLTSTSNGVGSSEIVTVAPAKFP